MDEYYSKKNIAKRQLQFDELINIENKIKILQKQYGDLCEKYSEDNYDIRKKFIIYTLVSDVPYGWESEGETHIGTIAESFEDNPGWLSSSARCE